MPMPSTFAATVRIEDRNQQIQREEQQQEGFGAGEFRRLVIEHAPHGANAEGEHETEQIEQSPRSFRRCPCDAENAEIQHRVIAEQRDVIAAAGGQPDRGHESGEDAEYRQRQRVLQHRQHANARDQRDSDRERSARTDQRCLPGDQIVQFVGRERHQHQHADGAALDRQRERPARLALSPCEHQPGDGGGGHCGEAQLDRHLHPALVAGVFQQRRHAEEQHQHADLHRHVALGEPAADPAVGRGEDVGRRRALRRAGGGGRGNALLARTGDRIGQFLARRQRRRYRGGRFSRKRRVIRKIEAHTARHRRSDVGGIGFADAASGQVDIGFIAHGRVALECVNCAAGRRGAVVPDLGGARRGRSGHRRLCARTGIVRRRGRRGLRATRGLHAVQPSVQLLDIAFQRIDPRFRVADLDQRHYQQKGHRQYRQHQQGHDSSHIAHLLPPSARRILSFATDRLQPGEHRRSLPHATMNCNRRGHA